MAAFGRFQTLENGCNRPVPVLRLSGELTLAKVVFVLLDHVLVAGLDNASSTQTEIPSPGTAQNSGRKCVVSENVVTILRRHVAGEAGFVQRLVPRSAVREVGESPTASRGVLIRVLDHELDIHGGPSNERLEARTGKAAG